MKASLAVPAALLLMVAAEAAAQTTPYPSVGPSSTVQVTAPAPAYDIWPHEADRVSGMYKLSNGWRLDVQPDRGGLVARIDKRPPIRLMAMSPERFVSYDGNVTMDFTPREDSDLVMSYVPDRRLAVMYVIKASVAQR